MNTIKFVGFIFAQTAPIFYPETFILFFIYLFFGRGRYNCPPWNPPSSCAYGVNYILKSHGILNVLSSEYAKVLNLSGVKIRCSYKGFWMI